MVSSAVLTISDRSSKGEREDISGKVLFDLLTSLPSHVISYDIIEDSKDLIKEKLIFLADKKSCDLIVTTGGTGIAPRDITPDATKEVIDKELAGIAEEIRRKSLEKTPYAMLSRMVSGVRGKTLIINFPGSPKAVIECFEIIRPIIFHAYELLSGKTMNCGSEM